MFWSNVVNSPRIERATLDGRERQVIVTGLGHVNSMTLDPTEGRLYWTNSDKGRIESSDLDGLNRVDIVAGLDQPFGLTLHGQHIYWIERYSHNILRADKTNGADQRLLVSSPVFPMAVTVFHTALNSGGCKFWFFIGNVIVVLSLTTYRYNQRWQQQYVLAMVEFGLTTYTSRNFIWLT